MLQILKTNLEQARNHMKQFANLHQTERVFVVGDWVYLRLQPYRQCLVARRQNLKLAPRFYGPYVILEKIGEVAYKLQLPPTSKIHPIFHVSLLKKKIGQSVVPSTTLPVVGSEGQLLVEPVKIVVKHVLKRGNQEVSQVLIQWSNSIPEDATWEDWENLSRKFPDFNP